MYKFIPGKAYYFTPCECIGRERRERRLVAVATANDEGRASFVLVGAVMQGHVGAVMDAETVQIENGGLNYFASASMPANVEELTDLLVAIRNNRELI